MTTKRRLTRVVPLMAGIVLGLLYGMAGLILAPIFFVAVSATRNGDTREAMFAVLMPFMYAISGFITGIIAAALYDLVAKWTGGLEFEVSDDRAVV